MLVQLSLNLSFDKATNKSILPLALAYDVDDGGDDSDSNDNNNIVIIIIRLMMVTKLAGTTCPSILPCCK